MASDATTTRDVGTPSGVRVAYALFGGILAWMAHLIGQSALVGRMCDTGSARSIHVLTVAVLVVTLHALWVGWRLARPAVATPAADAAKRLGWLAVFLNVASVVVIVVEWVPVFFLDPCVGT